MRITILDPTAAAPAGAESAEPTVSSLAGMTVGIRLDRAWRSFEWVADEWSAALRAAGAEVVRWVAGNRVGDEGERTRAELDDFASRVDVAVVGLGN
jgi:hypothetical protein